MVRDIQSNNIEEYDKLIAELTPQTVKKVFDSLPKENPELFKLLLHSFITKLVGISAENSNELVKYLNMVLSVLKPMENTVSVLFLLLENLSQKKDEIHRLLIFKLLKKQDFGVVNIINLLYKTDADGLVLDILRNKEEFTDEFIRESLKIDNPVVSKNISAVLPLLGPKYFINYNSFMFLFENENHYLRNCMIDIIEMLVLHFKDHSNIEAIRDLTSIVNERLCDVNFYVRSKALGCISNLFRNECILKDQRNILIGEILERAKDKTVIVRKKSINLLSQILLNHPFRNRPTLERSNGDLVDVEDINNTGKWNAKLEEDFNEFADLMECALATVVSLLDYNLKTDINEISSFIKTAYLLKLNGSKQAIHKILGVVFTKEKQSIIDVFKEILTQRGDVLYEFIDDKAFEIILGCLDVDEKSIYKNIYSGYRVFESIYVLKQIRKPISESNALALLQHVTNILFGSKSEEELLPNVKMYTNTLCIIRNLKYRIEHNHDIFGLAIKNLIKMVFFERSMVKSTIELFYSVSTSPEKTVGKFLKNLCLSKSTLKIVDSIGWIALNQFYLLERLEKKSKEIHKDKLVTESCKGGIDENLREKRKSLEENRRSSLGRLSIDRSIGFTDGSKLSLRFDELEDILKSKADEEVADFFFYLKEKEVLYSETSMLHQLLPVLRESLESTNAEIQVTAYSSLFKCMLISSENFTENLHLLTTALNHQSIAVRNVAVVALHDFILLYNSSIDNNILFDKLGDPDVNKNALLTVFNLLQKNVVRIKNNSVKLVSLLFDENLGNIVKTMIKTFSSNNNIISVIFYESYLSHLDSKYIEFLASFIGATIQESLFLKCLKASQTICNLDGKLKTVFESFELSEKFVRENMFREEMKRLVGE